VGVARGRVFSYLKTSAAAQRGKVVLIEVATLTDVRALYDVAIFIDGHAVRGVLREQARQVEVTQPQLAEALRSITPRRLNQVHALEQDGIQDTDCCFVSVSDSTGLSQVGFSPCFEGAASVLLPYASFYMESVPRVEGTE